MPHCWLFIHILLTSAKSNSESYSPFLFFSSFLLSTKHLTTPSSKPARIVAPLVSTYSTAEDTCSYKICGINRAQGSNSKSLIQGSQLELCSNNGQLIDFTYQFRSPEYTRTSSIQYCLTEHAILYIVIDSEGFIYSCSHYKMADWWSGTSGYSTSMVI